MYDGPREPLQVEMLAASLRANSADLNAFLEALATKLAGALPNQTQVIRQNSLFSREHPVKEIVVSFSDSQYRIQRERYGPLMTLRAKIVRGVVIKTDQIPMEQWIEEMAGHLARESSHSEQTRAALERFLL